jgi:hypothetical protein
MQFTIASGRRVREGDEKDYSGPDGVFTLKLVRISEPITEASSFSESGEWTFRRWTFAVEGGENDGEVLDLRYSWSGKPSKRSNTFQLLTALLGREPEAGDVMDDADLIGRECIGQIATNDRDYPYIKQLMPAPLMAPPKAAKPSPAAPAPEPTTDGLPF